MFTVYPKFKYDAHSALNERLERLNRTKASIGIKKGSRSIAKEHDTKKTALDPKRESQILAEEKEEQLLQALLVWQDIIRC